MPDTLAPEQPLSFAELVNLHNEAKLGPFFQNMDLPAYSRFMKEQTGTTLFDAGLSDSRIKRASLAVDKFLQPAATAAGNLGAQAAEGLGLGQYSDVVRRTTEGLPRSFLETLPVMVGGALIAAPEPTGLTKAAGAALIGAGGLSAGAKTYEETGSGLAGLISGAATSAFPATAAAGRQLVSKPLVNRLFYKPVAEQVGKDAALGFSVDTLVPRFAQSQVGVLGSELAKAGEHAVEWGGEVLGVTVANELAGEASSVAAGQGTYNPLTANHAAELAAGVLPFAAIDAAMHLHGRLTKDFSSRTGTENATYLGQVREAQQLADVADQITRYRNTEQLNKGRLLPVSVDPEGPPLPEGYEPQKPIITPPGPYEPKMNWTQIEERNRQARVLDIQGDVDTGVLTPEEGAQRIENIGKRPVEQPPVEPSKPTAALPTPLDKTKSTAQQTMQASETQFAAQLGAKEWFLKYFKNIGLDDAATERYSDVAQKIAAAFTDVGKTRIGELVEKGVAGRFFGKAPWSSVEDAFIGLVQLPGFKEPALSVFYSLHTAAHELWHGIQREAEAAKLDPVKTYQYTKLAEASAGLNTEVRSDLFMHVINMMVPEKLRGDTQFERIIAHRAGVVADDHIEFMADMAGALAMGLMHSDTASRIEFIKKEMKFSSPLVQQFAQAMYVPMRDIAKATLAQAEEAGLSQGMKDSAMFLSKFVHHTEAILTDVNLANKAVDALAAIHANDPVTYEALRANALVSGPVYKPPMMKVRYDQDSGSTLESSYQDAVGEAVKVLGIGKQKEMEKELGVQPGFVRRWFFPFAQLAAEYPQLLSVFNIARSYSALANDGLSQLMAPFLGKPSKFGHITIDPEAHGLRAVAGSKDAELQLRKLGLAQNEVSKVEKRRLTQAEIDQIVPNGTPQKAEVVDLFKTLTGEGGVYEKAAEMWVHKAGFSVSHAAAAMLMGKNKTLKWKDAVALGTGVRDIVIDSADPLKAPLVQQKLAYLQQVAGPTAVQSALEVARPMLEQVQKMDKLFQDNPGYSPETRLGQYLVMWKRPGSKEWGSFASDDFSTAKARLDKVRAEGAEKAVMRDKYDKNSATAGMDPDLVERYTAIDNAAFEAARRQLGESTPELDHFRELYSPGAAVAREVKSKGVGQFLMQRKLAEGREDSNAILGMMNYVSGVAHGLAKGYTREQAGLAFQDPELQSNPKLLDLARKHMDNVINPSAKELTFLKNMNFSYFLGFNFSSMLIEGSQGVLTFVPQITKDTGSLSAGYAAWGNAVKQVVQGIVAKDGKLLDKTTQTYLDRAVKEGRVDAGIMQEFNTVDENIGPNIRALASGSKLMAAGELVSKPLYWYLHASRWLYSWAPRANSHVAFVAAFDVARSKLKLAPEAAYDYATTTVARTMFGGGKAGRPVEMFANTGKLQGAVGLMYSLQTYTFSTIAMMARLGKESISSSDTLSPAQKSAARKAFGQMLLTQVALGGALSLPMSSGLVALVDQLFPEAEAKRRVKEAFHNLLDSGDGLSSHLSDIALKGLPDAVGLDLSSRVGLSSLLGVNPYSGFQVGNLLGPAGSVVENLIKGVQQVSSGDMKGSVRTILPTPYRNILQLAQDDGQVKDPQGKLLYSPNDVEKLLMVAGFRPKNVTDRQEAAQMVAKSNMVAAADLSRFYQEQRDLLLRGEAGSIREHLLQRAQTDKLFDPRSGARRIVEMSQESTIPVDISRSGPRSGAQSRLNIASMYGLPPGPTEQQLLLQRKSLERTLQIPGAGVFSPSEMVLARTVDYLMSIDPHMPRSEARLQAERVLTKRGQGPRL